MAYELTVEWLVAEALLRDPSVNVNAYRVGLNYAIGISEEVREDVTKHFESRGKNVSSYGRGFLDMIAALRKVSDGV